MKIGNVFIKGNVILAPMAGVCDMAFREICKSYGASLTVSEMASAKGITMNDKKTAELLTLSRDERPSSIQLFGNDPEIMARATEMAMEFHPDIIDINMGCPAPKVFSNGCGASLMKDVSLIYEITKAAVNASGVPVTVKMRAGIDENSLNAPEAAKAAEAAGASAVCVHGRTKQQMYALPVNFEIISKVKEAVKIPVIGNGDIKCGKDAEHMMKVTGCDGVMVGRGALGRPWVFKEINDYFNNIPFEDPDISYRMNALKNHIEKLCAYKGERVGMREARKHSAWYIRGIRGAAKFRNEICALKTIDDLYSLCDRVSSCTEADNSHESVIKIGNFV